MGAQAKDLYFCKTVERRYHGIGPGPCVSAGVRNDDFHATEFFSAAGNWPLPLSRGRQGPPLHDAIRISRLDYGGVGPCLLN